MYSRRIGAAPATPAAGQFVEYPATATILGAAKLTGRLDSGLSVGMLGAVTADEFARTFDGSTQFGRVQVAPQTSYGVARVQQEFGAARSTVGLMATMVHRELPEGSPLSSLLARNAFTLSSNALIRLRGGDYEVQLNGGLTHVGGEAAAIDRIQRSSTHYLQRPDIDYVVYDPRRTSFTGARSGAVLQRRNARHWLWRAGFDMESPEFEPNDVGFLASGDGIVGLGHIEYRETVPGRWWRGYSLGVATRNEWNFGGVLQQANLGNAFARLTPKFTVTWPNFWETIVEAGSRPRTYDQRLTRGGPSMERPAGWQVSVDVGSSRASQTRGDLSVDYGRDEAGGLTFVLNVGGTMQPGSQWQLSIQPEYLRERNTQQYLTTLPGGRAATYGSRYVFADIDRSTYSTSIRLNYTFKPDLTLDFYGEPFAASGRYSDVGELVAARTRTRRPYGEGDPVLPSRDFHVQSFRSNVVLRWEWRAGSTLYLVWQQNRFSEVVSPRRVSLGDMFGAVGRQGDNFFAVKTSLWFSPN